VCQARPDLRRSAMITVGVSRPYGLAGEGIPECRVRDVQEPQRAGHWRPAMAARAILTRLARVSREFLLREKSSATSRLPDFPPVGDLPV
jgi:hypothetical protein